MNYGKFVHRFRHSLPEARLAVKRPHVLFSTTRWVAVLDVGNAVKYGDGATPAEALANLDPVKQMLAKEAEAHPGEVWHEIEMMWHPRINAEQRHRFAASLAQEPLVAVDPGWTPDPGVPAMSFARELGTLLLSIAGYVIAIYVAVMILLKIAK